VEVLEKIQTELLPRSEELKNEIENFKISASEARVLFKNGSSIKVVTAADSARGNHANILIVDEYRLVKKDVVDTILAKFLTNPRMPGYLSDPQYEHLQEENKSFYLSSAYFKDHWSYTKVLDTCSSMMDDGRHSFVCGLPYQLALEEQLIMRSTIEDMISESDFNEVTWSMEMLAEFFGDEEGSFFDFASVSKTRTIKYPMLPDKLASRLHNAAQIRIPPKQHGEKRLLSADIALMSSKKHDNDASALFVNQMIPNRYGRYSSNIVYSDSAEGMHTEDQALMIRRLYEEYDCDYIVLDTVGVGIGVFDSLARDMTDPDTGMIYPALSCYNDPTMAERCPKGADKVIWSIKGTSGLNAECAVLLREGFKTGKIRLLSTEYDGDLNLSDINGYGSLNPATKLALQMPYIHTTLLINELVKLQHDESGGKIRLYEKRGMRKDRYSSLSYNFYVATQLENRLGRRNRNIGDGDDSVFMYRAPKVK
jgi:hypothetical protein